jgi:hypothetical protein
MRCELRCFTTSIAPSSEASAKWIGEALIDRERRAARQG